MSDEQTERVLDEASRLAAQHGFRQLREGVGSAAALIDGRRFIVDGVEYEVDPDSITRTWDDETGLTLSFAVRPSAVMIDVTITGPS